MPTLCNPVLVCVPVATSLSEFCDGPGTNVQRFNSGNISGLMGRAIIRVCFDDTASRGCRGDDVLVVATFTNTFRGYDLRNGVGIVSKNRGEMIHQSSIPFAITPDTMAEMDIASAFNEVEIDFDFDFSCFTDPEVKCGLVSSSSYVLNKKIKKANSKK